MRSAWVAAGLMALILVFCFTLNRMISDDVDRILDHLDESEWLADHGDFDGAQQALLSAYALWEDETPLLSAVIPAHHTVEVNAALYGLREQLACKDYKEYKAGNAQLVSVLEDLVKGVYINWENVM